MENDGTRITVQFYIIKYVLFELFKISESHNYLFEQGIKYAEIMCISLLKQVINKLYHKKIT